MNLMDFKRWINYIILFLSLLLIPLVSLTLFNYISEYDYFSLLYLYVGVIMVIGGIAIFSNQVFHGDRVHYTGWAPGIEIFSRLLGHQQGKKAQWIGILILVVGLIIVLVGLTRFLS